MITGNKRKELTSMIPKILETDNIDLLNVDILNLQDDMNEETLNLLNTLDVGTIVHFKSNNELNEEEKQNDSVKIVKLENSTKELEETESEFAANSFEEVVEKLKEEVEGEPIEENIETDNTGAENEDVKDIDVIKIWSGFGWMEDEEIIEFIDKYIENEDDVIVDEGDSENTIKIKKIKSANDKLRKIANTAETSNLYAYIEKLEEIKKESKSTLEIISIDKKIKSIKDSITLEPLMRRKYVVKSDKNTFKKSKIECNKKLSKISSLSFPSTNNLLDMLNSIFPNQEKKNLKACIHIYEYINRNKMSEEGLFIYFTLLNIEGLLLEINPLKDEIKDNLSKVIEYVQ